MSAAVTPAFWRGKKVFLTGHSGFKGSWLSLWLQSMGAIVKGFALESPTNPALYHEAKIADGMESELGDIRNLAAITSSMRAFSPDILIHMAAQPLVRLSYREPVGTYSTNVMGTVHVLEAARQCQNLRAIVNVTTDKCYENREWVWGYREQEPLGGHDPYSSSKGCSELVTAAYRSSFFNTPNSASIASARAGNVIGGGDWAEDRLIPDILRAFEQGQPAVIRNPLATRPWQHVLEPLSGYLMLAEKLYSDGGAFAEGWNFGPNDNDAKPVNWIVDQLCACIPGAKWRNEDGQKPHEAGLLKLDSSKAKAKLGWTPRWNIEMALSKTIEWHFAWREMENVSQLCLDQIRKYSLSKLF